MNGGSAAALVVQLVIAVLAFLGGLLATFATLTREQRLRRRLRSDSEVLKGLDGKEARMMRRIINADVAALHRTVFPVAKSPYVTTPTTGPPVDRSRVLPDRYSLLVITTTLLLVALFALLRNERSQWAAAPLVLLPVNLLILLCINFALERRRGASAWTTTAHRDQMFWAAMTESDEDVDASWDTGAPSHPSDPQLSFFDDPGDSDPTDGADARTETTDDPDPRA